MDLHEYYFSHRGKDVSESKISSLFPTEYNMISKLYGESFREKLYNYFHDSPCHICPECGSPTKFHGMDKGYSKFCSHKCSANSTSTRDAYKQTMMNKFGVDNASKSYVLRDKRKETIKERYGVEHALQSEEIRDKFRATCIDRFGVPNPSQNQDVQQKKERTCLQNHGVKSVLCLEDIRKAGRQAFQSKYGVRGPWESPELMSKSVSSKRLKFIEQYPDVIDIQGSIWICKCPHPDCKMCSERTYETCNHIYNDRARGGYELCTKLSPIGAVNQNTTLELIVQHWLDDTGVQYIKNSKSIIKGFELDFYIPDKKLAIECNGVYWHCDLKKDKKYHINKFKACEQHGIQLMQVWEDWIQNKPEIVKSLLLSKLGIFEKRLYARNCRVVQIDKTVAREFLDRNHIQGKTTCKVSLGLMRGSELVSVMTFNQHRGCQGTKNWETGAWELNRFCSLVGIQVLGGASKLLQYFIRHYNPTVITSFSANDISNGGLYERLGFKSDKSSPSYYYIHKGTMTRYHRSTYTKSAIVKRGWAQNKEGWKESEMMHTHGFLRIYDSGTTKWTLRLT